MSITSVETFDNQTTWVPFNGGSYTINSGKLTYTNTSTSQGGFVIAIHFRKNY